MASESVLFGAILLLLSWILIVVLSGGVDVDLLGLRVQSRDPFRPACLAVALMAVFATRYPLHAKLQLAHVTALLQRLAPAIAILLAVGTLLAGLRSGIFLVGGADSYGYVSQAHLWLHGWPIVDQPITRQVPWPLADLTFAPLGYRPGAQPGTLVPAYPPGLPITMAVAMLLFGACGPYLVTPILGALAVWLTYRLGARLTSPTLGVAAAALLVASPAFLFMLMWPMSDVPVTAFVAAAIVLLLRTATVANIAGAGAVLSIALFVRPNLAPLAACFALFVLLRAPDRRAGWNDAGYFVAGMLPGIVALATIHTHLYGAPWHSGYGRYTSFYAFGHLFANVARYPVWLLITQTPLIIACLVPFAFLAHMPAAVRQTIALLGAIIAIIWASYLFYLPFDEWWYLRFLLPAFPAMLVLMVIGWHVVIAAFGLSAERRAMLAGALFLLVFTFELGYARDQPTFNQRESERVYPSVAQFVEQHLPSTAVFITMQHSGSLRFYAGRMTMRWDWLESEWWPRAAQVLEANGHPPYLVLTPSEETAFRARFNLPNAPEALGTLVAELPGDNGVRIYDPLLAPTPPPRDSRADAMTSALSAPTSTPSAPASTSASAPAAELPSSSLPAATSASTPPSTQTTAPMLIQPALADVCTWMPCACPTPKPLTYRVSHLR